MSTADNVLVIVLSATLALLLLLCIVIAVQIIRLMSYVQRIARKAEAIVESAETVGTVFKNAAGPMALVRVIRNMVQIVQGNQKRSK